MVTCTGASLLFVAEYCCTVCLVFLMQKNILVDYGLRRITFLIAQEVSPLLRVSACAFSVPDSVDGVGEIDL